MWYINYMTAGLILLALVSLLGVLVHRRSRFEQRIFKNVPLIDWFYITVFPTFMFAGWVLIIKSIVNRPGINLIPIDDFDFLMIMVLFILYAFVGNGLHFSSKIIWRYLPHGDHHKLVYKVNEMFHNKLSHYTVYVTLFLTSFVGAIMELNHPVVSSSAFLVFWLITIMGVVVGFSIAKSIYYTNQWFGGYNRPLSVLVLILLICLVSIYKVLQVSIVLYPLASFITVTYLAFLTSFILRQFMIFTRLSHKHRLRFLAKIFSA